MAEKKYIYIKVMLALLWAELASGFLNIKSQFYQQQFKIYYWKIFMTKPASVWTLEWFLEKTNKQSISILAWRSLSVCRFWSPVSGERVPPPINCPSSLKRLTFIPECQNDLLLLLCSFFFHQRGGEGTRESNCSQKTTNSGVLTIRDY